MSKPKQPDNSPAGAHHFYYISVLKKSNCKSKNGEENMGFLTIPAAQFYAQAMPFPQQKSQPPSGG